jgi:hypothetical protein
LRHRYVESAVQREFRGCRLAAHLFMPHVNL